MTSLLDLPRELIHEIIEYSLLPPFIPSPASDHVNSEDWVTSGSPRRSGRVRSKDRQPIMLYRKKKPLHALLSTCRQLNVEVEDVMKRVGETLPCEASVGVTVDGDFLVTWLSIPPSMLNPNLAKDGYHIPSMNIDITFPRAPWTSGEQRSINYHVIDLFTRLIEEVLHFGPRPQEPPKPYRAPRRSRTPGGGLVRRKSTGGKAPRIRRVNFIDRISITLQTSLPTSASSLFLVSPRTGLHRIVEECIDRAFRSCIVDFMGIHKVPVEGGDEEDGVMEAWCYRHAHGVKRVELNVDGNVVAWLRIVEGAKEEINHDNGLFGAGDRICVRGRFDQIGLVPELDFET